MATKNTPSTYVVLRKGNKALFVLRSNTGYMDGCWGLPAGHVEARENFLAATVREASEEVGVTIDQNDLKHLFTMHRINQPDGDVRVDIFFETTRWRGEPKNMEPEKHSEIAWLDLDALPHNVMDYTAFALRQAAAGHAYSELGWEDNDG